MLLDKLQIPVDEDIYTKVEPSLLSNIYSSNIATWQTGVKRLIDVFASLFMMLLLSPLILYVALRTKFSSAGKIFYTQKRIGCNGSGFSIYKFRSMYEDAEKNGPALSYENDMRITKWGKTMRKWRLDELPQLWNIFKGEMSFVGPRPERKFYIDEINKRTGCYRNLLRIKPGLTSLGMVQFGYASNVDEMVKRMKYDMIYLKNFSILLDIKIMLYTLRTIFLGKGK